jgi:predicted HicB family RNase H-like nuclease
VAGKVLPLCLRVVGKCTQKVAPGLFHRAQIEENPRMRRGRDEELHRLTVRVPSSVMELVRQKADEDHRFVSDWVLLTLERALSLRECETFRGKQRRNVLYHRMTLRVPASLHLRLQAVSAALDCSIAEWAAVVLTRAVAKTK